MADVLDEHAEELAALEVANVGKPHSLAAEEMPICSDELRFFAGAARTMQGRRRASTARATRRSCGASRWGSSGRSRRGTTR